MARRVVWRREPNRRPSRRRRKPRGRPSAKPRGRRSRVRRIHATASNSPSVASYLSARFGHQRRDAAAKRPADKVDDEGVGDVEVAASRNVAVQSTDRSVCCSHQALCGFPCARRSGEGEQHTSPGIREVPERQVPSRSLAESILPTDASSNTSPTPSAIPVRRTSFSARAGFPVPIHLFCHSANGRLPGQRRLIAAYANRWPSRALFSDRVHGCVVARSRAVTGLKPVRAQKHAPSLSNSALPVEGHPAAMPKYCSLSE